MIFDGLMILAGTVSAAGALTGQAANGAGSILGTNTLDLGPPMLNGIPGQVGDMGSGEPIELAISILNGPSAGTSVQFQLIQADDAALTTNVQVINQTDAFPIASLPTGTLVPMHWDLAAPYAPRRYVGLRVVNVGPVAGMSVFCAATKNVQSMRTIFKSGFTLI